MVEAHQVSCAFRQVARHQNQSEEEAPGDLSAECFTPDLGEIGERIKGSENANNPESRKNMSKANNMTCNVHQF